MNKSTDDSLILDLQDQVAALKAENAALKEARPKLTDKLAKKWADTAIVSFYGNSSFNQGAADTLAASLLSAWAGEIPKETRVKVRCPLDYAGRNVEGGCVATLVSFGPVPVRLEYDNVPIDASCRTWQPIADDTKKGA